MSAAKHLRAVRRRYYRLVKAEQAGLLVKFGKDAWLPAMKAELEAAWSAYQDAKA